jgi:hypothetical protein
MSFNGITVVGLVSGMHVIEDIRVAVPYKVAVQIPAEQAHRSRDLIQDTQDKKILQIQGALPAGAVIRASGVVPRLATPAQSRPPGASEAAVGELRDLRAEVSRLNLELAASKPRELQLETLNAGLQTLNAGLQTTLTTMSSQLEAIQGLLVELKKAGITVAGFPSGAVPGGIHMDESIPRFIPESFKRDDVKINIQVEGQESQSSDVSSALKALKTFRKGKA